MKYDVSKKTAPKVLKQGKMNENSAIFALTGIKIHARPIVPMIFPVLDTHVSRAKFMYPDLIWKELCGMMGNPPSHTCLFEMRNDALRLKKASKITFPQLEAVNCPTGNFLSNILVRISFVFQIFFLSLHKISCTRQFESKLSLRSFALSLHKISCISA